MLTCEVQSATPTGRVRLAGALSLATAVDARTALHKVLAAHPRAVVVELSDVTIVDDVALTLFAAFARTAAEWPGCPVLLCAAPPSIRHELDRMAVSRVTPVFADLTSALAAAESVRAARRYRRPMPDSPTATALARRMVREACAAWQLLGLVADAELIVTELVANAIRHAWAPVEVLITLRERYVHLSVRDGSPVRPVRRLPDPDSGEGGRGLLLIDAVATGWGATEIAEGKVVWATLRHPPTPV
jgi:anti-anti-sigma regulatory factor